MTPFRRLLSYVDRYRRAFVLGLICSVATTVVVLVSPLVLQYAIDDLTRSVTLAKLLAYGSALLGIGLVGGVFRFWTRRILIGASRDIEYDMRNDFFAHLEKLPLAYFQAHRTGDLMATVRVDVPKKLSREEKDLLKQLQDVQRESPRKRQGTEG